MLIRGVKPARYPLMVQKRVQNEGGLAATLRFCTTQAVFAPLRSDLQDWKGGVVCKACQHFTYGVDQQCHVTVRCNLRQEQLQQGQHLKKRCKLWSSSLEIRIEGLLST